ncbi:MAG TPA: alpha/beta hydrolase [Spirochaetales bacterium]|nr:alpha/beta hydrolase [Spirochaetales bacterium]
MNTVDSARRAERRRRGPVPAIAIGLAAASLLVASCATYPARDLPTGTLESDGAVSVIEAARWTAFVPATPGPDPGRAGFIFYPGAYVAPEAYAPWLRRLAESGRVAVAVKVPFGVALLGAGRAAAVMEAFPATRAWALGGHSLGGVAAASFAAKTLGRGAAGNPAEAIIAGIAFLASYPAGGADLSGAPWPVLSLSASEDLLATAADIEEYRHLLPAHAAFRVIEGGNHAGFGSYGAQKGDGASTLAVGAQEDLVVSELADFLAAVEAWAAENAETSPD